MNLSTTQVINRTLDLLNVLRMTDPEMPIGAARVFFAVAVARDEPSMTDIVKRCERPRSTIHRYLHYLGKQGTRSRPGQGLGLVSIEPHPENGRQKVVRPTERGRLLMTQCANAVRPR